MILFRFFLFVLTISVCAMLKSNALAGESDDFTARADKKAPIANELINDGLNGIFDSVLYSYNRSEKKCSREKMLERMVDTFDRNFPDIYDPFGGGPLIEATAGAQTSVDSPMVKHWRVGDRMFMPSYKVKTSSGVHVMGIDKIDHFFAHGYLNWMMQKRAKTSDQKRNEIEVLKFNIAQEEAGWGLRGAGVKSYADLAANRLGIAFWENLFDGPHPILVCEKGRYRLSKKFDLFEYLDASVDETINCNSFRNKEVRDGIVGIGEKQGLTCPVDKKMCSELVQKRGKDVAELTIHPLCRGEAHSQIEEESELMVADVMDMGAGLVSGGTNILSFWMKRKVNMTLKPGKKQPAIQIEAGEIIPNSQITNDKKEIAK